MATQLVFICLADAGISANPQRCLAALRFACVLAAALREAAAANTKRTPDFTFASLPNTKMVVVVVI